MKMRHRKANRAVVIEYGKNASRYSIKGGKMTVLQHDPEAGYDEHNCWDWYLILRYKKR